MGVREAGGFGRLEYVAAISRMEGKEMRVKEYNEARKREERKERDTRKWESTWYNETD